MIECRGCKYESLPLRDCTTPASYCRAVVEMLESENKELQGEIGSPPEGSHPDEASPRDETWHGERLNWIEQVKALKAENKKLRELLVLAKPYIKSLNLLGDVEMALDPVFKKLVADELKEQ